MQKENRPNKARMRFQIQGGGAAGDLFRAIDWSKHPLGSLENWPAALKTSLSIIFHSRHPMFIWWGNELYQFYNDGYLPSFGAVGKHPSAMGQRGEECWPEIWSIIKPQIDHVMLEGGSTWNENQYIPIFRNGKLEDVYWTYGYSPILNDDGTVGGTLVVCTETTQQVLMQKSLAESEKRLNLALNSGNIGFWDWNSKSGKVFLSETLMQDWGIDPDSFNHTLSECFERIHPDDRERVWHKIQESTFEQRPYDVEYRVNKPNGEEIYIHAKGRNFICEYDESLRLTGIAINITERKRSDTALREAKAEADSSIRVAEKAKQDAEHSKEEAERANHLKSAFLANMSHEIRTPLGAILGFSEFLLDPKQTVSDRQECIETIRRNAEILSRLINELLDLSKIEADRLEIDKVEFELDDVIQDVYQLLGIHAREKGITLKFFSEDSMPTRVTTDPMRLRQILINVIGNAIKFTEKGCVSVHMRMMPPEKPAQPLKLKFAIQDTGIGLAADQIERIWDPFVQADISTTRKFGGTGLGLSVSQRLAAALGGNLSLTHSEPGVGSLFTLVIEAGLPNASSPLMSTRSPGAMAKPVKTDTERHLLDGSRILLVEDSPDNQKLVSRFLMRAGAHVDIANDGREGVEKALAEMYDVVLMDIQMPILDGYEATSLLRQKGFDAPIIALTAHAMKRDRERALASGFDDHIPKPIDRRVIIEKVTGFFRSRKRKLSEPSKIVSDRQKDL